MEISLNGSDWQVMGLPPGEWAWRRVGDAEADLDNLAPAAPPWFPATVPGDVQSDLEDAGELPDWRRDLNSRACEWTSQRDWVYRKEFDFDAAHAGRTVILRFEGVDYACRVFLNGRALGEHEGTYTPFEFDVTEAIRPGERNRLVVVVERAPSEPEVQGQIGWTGRIRHWKPRFAYGWDWCARLVPLGIIDDVKLLVCDTARIREILLATALHSVRAPLDLAQVGVRAVVEKFAQTDVSVAIDVWPEGDRPFDSEGESGPILEAGNEEVWEADIRFAPPALWWPNGSGDRPFYRLEVRLTAGDGRELDARTLRFGIRQVRAVPGEGAPEGALPYALEVNGVRTFIKGWNWAPIDQLYGRSHEAQYRHAIRMAQEAHCNLLRVWGGGLLERELFYDLCDEAGIMVWQEFFQSSSGIDNAPAADDQYAAYVQDQARQIVPRRVHHPSLVLWCGGNELTAPDMTPLGSDHPALAALKETVEVLDPSRLWLPTSPSGPVFAAAPENRGRMHDVHGHWLYMGDPEHYRFYNAIDPLLHSEFGCEGAANLPTLRRTLSDRYLWPPDRSNPGWVHHGAWWLHRPAVERLFGPLESLEDFVRASQWVQAEGLRYAVEATRRRGERTAGCIPWQFNESWPNASGTYALDYYGHPRPAYWMIRDAYAPVLVSAEYEKLVWRPGETFRAALWVNADAPLPAGSGLLWQWFDARTGELMAWDTAAVGALRAAPGAARVAGVTTSLPDAPGVFALCLTLAGGPGPGGREIAGAAYLFSTTAEAPFGSLLRAPAADLAVGRRDPDGFTVETGASPAYGIRVETLRDYAGPYLQAGYRMFMPPRAALRVGVSGPGRVFVSAWNADPVEVEVG